MVIAMIPRTHMAAGLTQTACQRTSDEPEAHYGDMLGAFDALRCDLGFAGVVAIPLLDRLLVHIPLYHSNSFRTSALSRQFAMWGSPSNRTPPAGSIHSETVG